MRSPVKRALFSNFTTRCNIMLTTDWPDTDKNDEDFEDQNIFRDGKKNEEWEATTVNDLREKRNTQKIFIVRT